MGAVRRYGDRRNYYLLRFERAVPSEYPFTRSRSGLAVGVNGAELPIDGPSLVLPLNADEFEAQLSCGEVRAQTAACPDKEYPEIRWTQYGIVSTDEVMVVARCGDDAYFAKAPSYVVFPAMVDRVFGTDVEDIRLGQQLADILWERYSPHLIARAALWRAARGS